MIDTGWRLAERYEGLRATLVGWFVLRRTPDPEEMADRTIERCLQAERRGQALCITYVFRAAKSVLVDELRRLPAGVESIDPPELRVETDGVSFARQFPDPTARTEERVVNALEAERLLERFTTKQAQVVRLFADGYSHHEIGEELGLPTTATKKLLWRARHAAIGQRAREDRA